MKKQTSLIIMVAAVVFIALASLIVGLNGCDSAVSDTEAAELINSALSKEKASEIDAAELIYRDILKKSPANAEAHFRLGVLLQNHRKNYLEAIHHYMAYLEIKPDSDLTPTVKKLLDSATVSLKAQWLNEEIDRTQTQLKNEIKTLKSQFSALESTKEELNDLCETKDKEIKELKRRLDNLTRMVNEMKDMDVKLPTHEAYNFNAIKDTNVDVKDLSSETSSDEIEDIRNLANLMKDEKDGGQAKINEATRLATEGKTDAENIVATPTPGKAYVVRPGDSYYSIARDAYGAPDNWQKIRDANRGHTNPDARLKAGEKITIPML